MATALWRARARIERDCDRKPDRCRDEVLHRQTHGLDQRGPTASSPAYDCQLVLVAKETAVLRRHVMPMPSEPCRTGSEGLSGTKRMCEQGHDRHRGAGRRRGEQIDCARLCWTVGVHAHHPVAEALHPEGLGAGAGGVSTRTPIRGSSPTHGTLAMTRGQQGGRSGGGWSAGRPRWCRRAGRVPIRNARVRGINEPTTAGGHNPTAENGDHADQESTDSSQAHDSMEEETRRRWLEVKPALTPLSAAR